MCIRDRFLDGWQFYDPKMVKTMGDIAAHIPEFWYGRFDLKAKSPQDLVTGKHLKVLEINGVQSEPTHIYDPKHHLLYAYRSIAQHVILIWKISKQNRRRGFKYPPFIPFFIEMRAYLGRKKRV